MIPGNDADTSASFFAWRREGRGRKDAVGSLTDRELAAQSKQTLVWNEKQTKVCISFEKTMTTRKTGGLHKG